MFVRLCDVTPNGRSTNVSGGFVRVRPREFNPKRRRRVHRESVDVADGQHVQSRPPVAYSGVGECASALRRATWGRTSHLRPRQPSGPHAMRSSTTPITRRCSISRSSRRQGRRVQQVGWHVRSFQGDGVADVRHFGEPGGGERDGRYGAPACQASEKTRPQRHRANGLLTELGGTAANHGDATDVAIAYPVIRTYDEDFVVQRRPCFSGLGPGPERGGSSSLPARTHSDLASAGGGVEHAGGTGVGEHAVLLGDLALGQRVAVAARRPAQAAASRPAGRATNTSSSQCSSSSAKTVRSATLPGSTRPGRGSRTRWRACR